MKLINAKKTGALFRCAAEFAGGVSGNDSLEVSVFGLKIGLVFQAVDDVLDGGGDAANQNLYLECQELSQALGSLERKSGKSLVRSRQIAQKVINQLKSGRETFPVFAPDLP